jgi:hypothetical protein
MRFALSKEQQREKNSSKAKRSSNAYIWVVSGLRRLG